MPGPHPWHGGADDPVTIASNALTVASYPIRFAKEHILGGFDWNAEAVIMAEHVAQNLADRPGGAIPGRQARVSVVFGNESGRDPQAIDDEVARIRDNLDAEGIRVLGFAVAPGVGETWAMIVESEDIPLLESLIQEQAD